jgi:hypothetical protein
LNFSSYLGFSQPPHTNLERLLSVYPPYISPHVGFGMELNRSAAEENLAYFNSVYLERLDAISILLHNAADIDVYPALAAPKEHGPALADALHRWAINSWQPLAEHREKTMKSWLHTTRLGENIIFSMLLDIAFLLGEVIRRGNSDWHWGIDLCEVNLRDGMASARRIVLLADPVGKHLETFDLDIEAIVVDLFLHGIQVTQKLQNNLRIAMEEAFRGDYKAFWQQM